MRKSKINDSMELGVSKNCIKYYILVQKINHKRNELKKIKQNIEIGVEEEKPEINDEKYNSLLNNYESEIDDLY